ncbi:MAG: type III pantothenate kinase [Micavibrio sp.]|nr:MAG: type III pantothenate kinase [Micavibrio sp.]
MLLAVDIGNTNTVLALFEGERLVRSWRMQTGAGSYDVTEENISDVIVSSVVPDEDKKLQEFCRENFSVEPIFVDASHTGLEVDLDRPEEIGADRLVNAVAVVCNYSAPAIVVDFGTATTFDVIDADGHYKGGVIAPGVNLSVSALERAAAKLPKVDIKKPLQVIGKNTEEAIQSGIYWGYVGLIEGLITKITEEIGVKPFVLATGGLAPLFAPAIELIEKVDEELTLRGLLRIYQAQKQNKQQNKEEAA